MFWHVNAYAYRFTFALLVHRKLSSVFSSVCLSATILSEYLHFSEYFQFVGYDKNVSCGFLKNIPKRPNTEVLAVFLKSVHSNFITSKSKKMTVSHFFGNLKNYHFWTTFPNICPFLAWVTGFQHFCSKFLFYNKIISAVKNPLFTFITFFMLNA